MTPTFTKEPHYYLSKSELEEIIGDFILTKELKLPAPISAEIYGYGFNGRIYKNMDELRGCTMSEDNLPVTLYTHPAQVNGYSLDSEDIDILKEVLQNLRAEDDTLYSVGSGDLIEKIINSALPTKEHPAPVVWPKNSDIVDLIEGRSVDFKDGIYAILDWLKQRMEGNGNG